MSQPLSNPADARQVRTRQSLHLALLDVLGTVSFEHVTIREIARIAGVGYATFFRHYPSKDALLHDVAAGQVAELLTRALPMLFAKDSRRSCAAVFDYVAERRTLWAVLLTGGAATMLRQEFVDQARIVAQREGGAGGWLPDDLRVVFGVSATVDILAWWLEQGADMPISRMAEILDRLVVAPAMAVE